MNDLVTQQHFAVSDLERMANALAKSKLFGAQTPEQALALCLIAQAEGRHPASAAADYHIINGRPSKKADAMLRDFILGGGKVTWHKLDDTIADATFSHPAGGEVQITWDADRVKRAGIQNAMHGKYPRQMLRARTVSEGVRTVFPAATSGMYVPDEVEVMEPIRDVTPRKTPPQPKSISVQEATPFDDEPITADIINEDEIADDWKAYADDLEHEIDTAEGLTAVALFNAATKTEAWDALKRGDKARADAIKGKVLAKKAAA